MSIRDVQTDPKVLTVMYVSGILDFAQVTVLESLIDHIRDAYE